jgi:hypothetical protein
VKVLAGLGSRQRYRNKALIRLGIHSKAYNSSISKAQNPKGRLSALVRLGPALVDLAHAKYVYNPSSNEAWKSKA